MCILASSCTRPTNNMPTNMNKPTDFNMLTIVVGIDYRVGMDAHRNSVQNSRVKSQDSLQSRNGFSGCVS